MASSPALGLPQQFGRFLLVGALVFFLTFSILSSTFVSSQDIRRDKLALRFITKTFTFNNTDPWIEDLKTGYLPFFLQQRSLVVSYAAAVQLAWFVAFLFDTKILRKEKTIL